MRGVSAAWDALRDVAIPAPARPQRVLVVDLPRADGAESGFAAKQRRIEASRA